MLFGAISLVAGVILAFNALLLASGERQRFIAYLIEIGTPDSMIVASLAFDALILGLLGCALGLLAGDLISFLHTALSPATSQRHSPSEVRASSTPKPCCWPSRVASSPRSPPPDFRPSRSCARALRLTQAVGRTLSFTRKLRLSDALVFGGGALLVGASVVVALLQPATTVVALIGLVVGLVVCLPMLARYLLRIARAGSERSGDPAVHLSLAELRGAPTRAVALLATGTVAAFLMVLIGGSVANVKQAASRGATDLLSNASLWVKPGGPEDVYTTEPFNYRETQRRLQKLSVVAAVQPWRDSFLDLRHRRVWVLGVPPAVRQQIAPSQLIDGSLAVADKHLREGGWIAVSQPIASEYHVPLGGLITLPTPAGNTTFRLAATIANYGWLPGAIVMDASEHARLWSSASASSSLSRHSRYLDRRRHASGAARAAEWLRSRRQERQRTARRSQCGPGQHDLQAQRHHDRRADRNGRVGDRADDRRDLAAPWTTQLADGRRHRLGQFARLITYESGSVLISGCLIGTAAGLFGQYLIDGWLHQTTGASVLYAPAWQLGLQTDAFAALISILASAIAVAQAGGFQPRVAFSME